MRAIMSPLYKSHARFSIAKSAILVLLLLNAPWVSGREVQDHGLWFERWLCDAFFDGYRPPQYNQKWDIPAEANRLHGHLPVNPKASKFGTSIGLGDAVRQFDITQRSESFILAVGFWEQSTPQKKAWVNAQAVVISPEKWLKLWHPITLADLEKLDSIVKNPALSLEEARQAAHDLKSKAPFIDAVIQVNPKIDRSQRRLQCSLGFAAFFDHLLPGVSRDRQKVAAIWGVPIPEIPDSGSRNLKGEDLN
jgi:hypothetical protein